MNRQNLEKKEIRLGTIQIVGLLGITIGSIIAAFCLGFYSGRSLVFEKELNNALAALPKLPVSGTVDPDLGDKIVSEVYAKLNEQNENEDVIGQGTEDESAFPELGAIKEEKAAELSEESAIIPELPANGAAPSAETKSEKAAELSANNGLPESAVIDPTTRKQLPGGGGRTLAEEKDSLKALEAAEESPLPAPTVKIEPTPKPEAARVIKAEPTKAAPAKVERSAQQTADTKGGAAITPRSKIAKGWYAQIAAPKEIEEANALASNLKQSGFPVAIETAEVRGERYFRVVVGPESKKSQADVLLKQLKRESYITGDPFLRLVK